MRSPLSTFGPSKRSSGVLSSVANLLCGGKNKYRMYRMYRLVQIIHSLVGRTCPPTRSAHLATSRHHTSAPGLSRSSCVVFSTVGFAGLFFIRLNDPFPHWLGKKKTFALECANVRKFRLDLEAARPSAQSISLTSVSKVRFCRENVLE